MKRIFLSFILVIMIWPLAAQINFREVDFTEALKAAQSENKLVFMDCYTVWCGPCKRLSSEVFSQKKAGDHFNPRFVSLKMDMEKGEGLELRKKYDVNAYPTLLVLNDKGELLCRYAGYLDVDQLIAFVDNGVKGGGLTDMQKRYEAGERSIEFICNYLAMLDEAAMSTTLYAVANDFLKDKTEAVLTDKKVYGIFRAYITPKTPLFQQVYARKAELVERHGERAGQHLDSRWEAFGSKYLKYEARKVVGYDAAGLDDYYALMKKNGVPEAEAIRAKYLLEGARATENWPLLLDALTTYATFSRLEEGSFNYACCVLELKQPAPKARKELASLIRQRIEALKGIKDTSGRTMTVQGETMPIMEYYRRSYEELLQKLN